MSHKLIKFLFLVSSVFFFVLRCDHINMAQEVNGGQIIYTAFSGSENSKLYMMNLDGTNVVQLTNDDFSYSEPSWSPDASRILFVLTRNSANNIYIRDADGTNEIQLTTDNHSFNPTWSPNGSQIAFTRSIGLGSAVYVMSVDGTNQRKISSSDGTWIDGLPIWSPDGFQLAFVSDRNYEYNPVTAPYDLYTFDIDAHEEHFVTSLNSRPRRMNWLSDGQTMILDLDTGGQTIFQLNLPTLEFSLISSDNYLENADFSPDVSNDETYIAFVSSGDIYLMNIDGTNRINLTNTPQLIERYVDIQPIEELSSKKLRLRREDN